MSIFTPSKVEPYFKYEGKFFGAFMCKYAPKTRVYITVSDTINKNIKLVNVYIGSNRVTGVRYHKDRIGIFEIQVLLDRIYWDYFA